MRPPVREGCRRLQHLCSQSTHCRTDIGQRDTLRATQTPRKVNREKSAVDRPSKRKFLGFSFTKHQQRRRRIAPDGIERFKQRIRDPTRRTRGCTLEEVIACRLQKLGQLHGTWPNDQIESAAPDVRHRLICLIPKELTGELVTEDPVEAMCEVPQQVSRDYRHFSQVRSVDGKIIKKCTETWCLRTMQKVVRSRETRRNSQKTEGLAASPPTALSLINPR